jgi:hypothetical protein
MSLGKRMAAGLLASVMALGTATAADGVVKGAKLVEMAAQPYVQFRDDVSAVAAVVPGDAQGMREAHNRLASYDNRALAGAWVAYAAMVAADTPAFASEIEQRMKSRRSREAFLEELESNPAMIRNIPGAEQAVKRIMTVATNDSARLREMGDAFIASAYDMQKEPWARRELALAGMQRVNSALSYAAKRDWANYSGRESQRGKHGAIRPTLASHSSWSDNWAGVSAPLNPTARAGTVITKALIVGAHYTMDTATQSHLASFGTSKKSERCFSSAKMNLAQCIAATRTPYEEAFCLGQHALNDISSCVGWPAGAGAAGT